MATPFPTRISKDKPGELEKAIDVSVAPDCTKAGRTFENKVNRASKREHVRENFTVDTQSGVDQRS